MHQFQFERDESCFLVLVRKVVSFQNYANGGGGEVNGGGGEVDEVRVVKLIFSDKNLCFVYFRF